jgi:hypothetical protein
VENVHSLGRVLINNRRRVIASVLQQMAAGKTLSSSANLPAGKTSVTVVHLQNVTQGTGLGTRRLHWHVMIAGSPKWRTVA